MAQTYKVRRCKPGEYSSYPKRQIKLSIHTGESIQPYQRLTNREAVQLARRLVVLAKRK